MWDFELVFGETLPKTSTLPPATCQAEIPSDSGNSAPPPLRSAPPFRLQGLTDLFGEAGRPGKIPRVFRRFPQEKADTPPFWSPRGVNFDFFEPVRILVLERFSQLIDKCRTSIHQKLNGTESQRTPDQVSCDRAIRYSGFFGVRSVGPVGDFLDLLNRHDPLIIP